MTRKYVRPTVETFGEVRFAEGDPVRHLVKDDYYGVGVVTAVRLRDPSGNATRRRYLVRWSALARSPSRSDASTWCADDELRKIMG